MPREGFIIDFAGLKPMRIIEIDGAQHGQNGHRERDADRGLKLATAGFKILRFWNHEVNENLDGVVETIYLKASARLSAASSLPFRGRCRRNVAGGETPSASLVPGTFPLTGKDLTTTISPPAAVSAPTAQ